MNAGNTNEVGADLFVICEGTNQAVVAKTRFAVSFDLQNVTISPSSPDLGPCKMGQKRLMAHKILAVLTKALIRVCRRTFGATGFAPWFRRDRATASGCLSG